MNNNADCNGSNFEWIAELTSLSSASGDSNHPAPDHLRLVHYHIPSLQHSWWQPKVPLKNVHFSKTHQLPPHQYQCHLNGSSPSHQPVINRSSIALRASSACPCLIIPRNLHPASCVILLRLSTLPSFPPMPPPQFRFLMDRSPIVCFAFFGGKSVSTSHFGGVGEGPQTGKHLTPARGRIFLRCSRESNF